MNRNDINHAIDILTAKVNRLQIGIDDLTKTSDNSDRLRTLKQ